MKPFREFLNEVKANPKHDYSGAKYKKIKGKSGKKLAKLIQDEYKKDYFLSGPYNGTTDNNSPKVKKEEVIKKAKESDDVEYSFFDHGDGTGHFYEIRIGYSKFVEPLKK